MMNVKVQLSIGLVLIALLHALVCGVVSQSSRECECQPAHVHAPRLDSIEQEKPSDVLPYPAISGPANGINPAALQETKQAAPEAKQIDGWTVTPVAHKLATPALSEDKGQGVVKSQAAPCMPCQQQRRPYYVQPTYVQPNYVQPAQPYVQPYVPAAQPTVQQPKPPYKPLKLALFLDGGARSSEVLQWFTHEPELARLRANCEFQVYSPSDTLYRTKYASIVPANAMPALLWSHQLEGDVNQKAAAQIYAAGGDLFPRSSAQLVHDMRAAYGLFEQVKNAPVAKQMQPPTSTGIRWGDQFASPQLILNEASFESDCPGGQCPDDCPDGVCPVDDEQSPFYRPFARTPDQAVQGPFRDMANLSIESIVAIVIVFAACAFGVYSLNKRQ